MSTTKPTVKIGVWVQPEAMKYCSSNDWLQIRNATDDPAAFEYLTLTLDEAAFDYNFTCVSGEMVPFSEKTPILNQMVHHLRTNEIDTIGTLMSYSARRAEMFEFSQLFSTSPFSFVVRHRDTLLSEGAMLLLKGLSQDTWLAWLISTILAMLTFSFIKAISQKGNGQSAFRLLFEKFWYVLRFPLSQTDDKDIPEKEHSFSNGIIFFALSYVTIVMAGLYQTVLYSQISNAAKTVPFRSTEELVSQIGAGKLTLVTSNNDTAYFDQIRLSNQSHFTLMRKALESNPVRLVPTIRAAIDMLQDREGRYVLVTYTRLAKQIAMSYCHLEVIDLEMPTMWAGYIFNKNRSDLIKPINYAILRTLGRFDHLAERPRRFYTESVGGGCDNAHHTFSLSLNTLSGLFVLYCALSGVALVCFVMERFWSEVEKCFGKCRRSNSSKNGESARKAEESISRNVNRRNDSSTGLESDEKICSGCRRRFVVRKRSM